MVVITNNSGVPAKKVGYTMERKKEFYDGDVPLRNLLQMQVEMEM